MTVLETFAATLTEQGIPAAASTLPDQDTILAALDRIDTWFWDLDPAVREGYDEATGEERLCRMLADPDDPNIGIATDISTLLDAFDDWNGGMTLSQMVPAAREALQDAIDSEQGVG